MKKQHLINSTYQVVDNDNSVLFQGSASECDEYIMSHLLSPFNDLPGLIDTFTTMTR